jgi:uracil-DNA glycosylase
MPRAFISHCMQDADFAQRIAAGLRAQGIDVWIAPDSIRPGEEFVDAIQRGLSGTTHFVLVMSPEAFESQWVKLEINTAIRLERDGHLAISPVLYRDCKPPLLLGNFQWLNYSGDDTSIVHRLMSQIGPAESAVPKQRWSEPRSLTVDDAAAIQRGLDEITAQARVCTLCPLQYERTIAAPGDGPPGARIIFIGEAPGPEDDKTGKVFVSAAGQFLDELMGLISVRRDDVFITNIVKCRPNKNRDPEPYEVKACSDYLDRQIGLLDPRVIVTLGSHALNRIAPGHKLSKEHGQPIRLDERIIFPMYHPAAALYRVQYRNILIKDFIEMDKYLAAMPVA